MTGTYRTATAKCPGGFSVTGPTPPFMLTVLDQPETIRHSIAIGY